jgi:Uma2 family endonuclease
MTAAVAMGESEAGAFLPPSRMTWEEFVAWGDEDTWAEWEADGRVTLLSSNTAHQLIVGFLLSLFQLWIEARSGGMVLTAPFLMRARPNGAGREPDILYIAPENLSRVSNTVLNGPADLVVEVVSPESRQRDRDVKFFEYERAGVREYWIFDPDTETSDFYRLDDTGTYRRVPPNEEGGTVYTSAVLDGFTLDTVWLWQRPLPTLMSVLRGWGLI